MAYTALHDMFEFTDGFPRPDWIRMRDWIQANVKEKDLFEAWDCAAEIWLTKVRDHLRPKYELDALNEFALLSPFSADLANAILTHAASAKESMQEILSMLPKIKYKGSHVIIAFDSVKQYCTYITPFYPDGEYGLAPACTILKGYMHMVFGPASKDHMFHFVTHELAHVLLAHLSLPLWLEEGMIQILVDRVQSSSSFRLDHETVARHRDYWKKHGLNGYWAGTAFNNSDDGRELSYSLSQVLVRNLSTDFKNRFFDFVSAAKRPDAGDAAMREHLGLGLDQCATQFLGPGDWSYHAEPSATESTAK